MDRGGEPLSAINGGAKRKIDDEIERAKQKAQAIAARYFNDADSKRSRTGSNYSLPSPPSSFSSVQSSFPVPYTTQTSQYNGVPSSKKIFIPNAKVGVIIGRGGDMIKNIQQQSGARVQITRDADADLASLTRDVELMGTQEQISRAEELINEVIAETDAANSASSGNRNAAPLQPGSEQFVMKVPNDKVALIIGKGGETIKSMQSQSGAQIQVVPLHLPPGDTVTERSVYINGTNEQIESAKELVNEFISGNRLNLLSGTNTYTQSAYAPTTSWPPQGQPPAQKPPAYGYTQPESYPMQPPPYYGGYPPQLTGGEQQTTAAAAPLQPQNTGYNTYGQEAPPASTPPNVNYNYSQMPPATGHNYSQGYPQQPPYGQDLSGQAPALALAPADPAKPYSNSPYGPPATSSQADGSVATQISQPGYGTPTPSGQPDRAVQSQPSVCATGYNQPPAAPAPSANGYGAYPDYSQTGYPQMSYGQQQGGQVSNQESYSYYGQSGYSPAQSGYHQGAYPSVPPPQVAPQTQPQSTDGVSQAASYGAVGASGGDATTGPGAVTAAKESENPQS